MIIIIWTVVFIAALTLLVKSADWFLESSSKIGLAAGLSPFIIGVTIVGLGTSLPELISSIVAVFEQVPEVVVANAVGSNIANIFLVVGAAVLFARRLSVSKDLIDLDLPLLTLGTAIFFVMAWDGAINTIEAIFLLVTYGLYLSFSIIYREKTPETADKQPVVPMDWLFLFIGIVGLAVGSKYLIDSVIELSTLLHIGAGVITITAVAIGTSLPELLVSIKAAKNNQPEVALGNVFGSNIFNVLVVVGLPGIFGSLVVDAPTMAIGFPILIVATAVFVISGISRRIHVQEGALYLMLYVIFIAKLFGFF